MCVFQTLSWNADGSKPLTADVELLQLTYAEPCVEMLALSFGGIDALVALTARGRLNVMPLVDVRALAGGDALRADMLESALVDLEPFELAARVTSMDVHRDFLFFTSAVHKLVAVPRAMSLGAIAGGELDVGKHYLTRAIEHGALVRFFCW